MKKSLFAVAAATAFTGAAQAQSSVTVYGILDVGYTNGDARINGTKQNVSRISNSMESGSRLGFRGNEDLGGGTSAQFVFEVGIQPAGNAGSNPDGAAAGATGAGTWNPNVRQAFVGLSQKGLGNARVGTQNTLFWEQAGSNTAGQLSQTAGSMLAPTIEGAFFNTTVNSATATALVNGSALGSYTSRTTNTIRIATERMSGVMLKAAYTVSNQNTNQTNPGALGTTGYGGGTSNQMGYQLALDWNIQKANIQASYASFKSENPFGAVTAACSANASAGCNTSTVSTSGGVVAWGAGTQGNNVTDAQALVTASYDFGILKAFAGWTQRTITSGLNSNLYGKRTAQEIGVRGYATKTIEYWGSVGNGRYQLYGNNNPTANITGYQLGSNYWMSKRTNLYAIYGQNNTSSTSAGAGGVSQFSIGARHTF
ncbi:OmpC Outer membrane protein (porin) [Burkholderiaceae bacterium]